MTIPDQPPGVGAGLVPARPNEGGRKGRPYDRVRR
jgi:hypothetical protein